jgi:hypothetical protein
VRSATRHKLWPTSETIEQEPAASCEVMENGPPDPWLQNTSLEALFLLLSLTRIEEGSKRVIRNDRSAKAGAILSWIYGDPNAPAKLATAKFLVFDRSPFATGFGNGLSTDGPSRGGAQAVDPGDR